MSQKTSKTGRVYRKFEATAENWTPQYTKILGFVQKNLPDTKISELIGVSAVTVSKVRRSPYFQVRLDKALAAYEKQRANRLADIQSEDMTMTKLEKSARRAATILVKALKGDTSITKQQIAVAKDLLDRTGYKAVEKQEITHSNKDYTPEEVESARDTMIEMMTSLDELASGSETYVISTPGSSTIKRPVIETVQDTNTTTDLAEDLSDGD